MSGATPVSPGYFATVVYTPTRDPDFTVHGGFENEYSIRFNAVNGRKGLSIPSPTHGNLVGLRFFRFVDDRHKATSARTLHHIALHAISIEQPMNKIMILFACRLAAIPSKSPEQIVLLEHGLDGCLRERRGYTDGSRRHGLDRLDWQHHINVLGR